ncbi:MAG: proline dehydrogenase family protein [Pseudomonadota bacterium]
MAELQLVTSTQSEPDRGDVAAHLLMEDSRLVGGFLERLLLTDDERRRLVSGAEVLAAIEADDALSRAESELDLTTSEFCELLELVALVADIRDERAAAEVISERLSPVVDTDGMAPGHTLPRMYPRLGRVLNARNGVGFGDAESTIRAAISRATNILDSAFICGPSFEAGAAAVRQLGDDGVRPVFSLMGRRPTSLAAAQDNFELLVAGIRTIANDAGAQDGAHRSAIFSRPALVVRLADLHPRFGDNHGEEVRDSVALALGHLAATGAANGVMVLVDTASEADLDATLAVFGATFVRRELQRWDGFGLTVSAQSKRAIPALRWLRRLALEHDKRMPVRLAEYGADWVHDAQATRVAGLDELPVLSTTNHLTLSMLASAKFLISEQSAFHPIFATVSPVSLSAIQHLSPDVSREIEHPWGIAGARVAIAVNQRAAVTGRRVNARIGAGSAALAATLQDLLRRTVDGTPYCVTSRIKPETVQALDPVTACEAARESDGGSRSGGFACVASQPSIARGVLFSEPALVDPLRDEVEALVEWGFAASPFVAVADDALAGATPVERFCPHDRRRRIGTYTPVALEAAEAALASGARASAAWEIQPVGARTAYVTKAAHALKTASKRHRAIALLVGEGGMTLPNAVDELRSSIEMLEWVAGEAQAVAAGQLTSDHPGGTVHSVHRRGLGQFLTISSPWRPLSTLLGQVSSALTMGNTAAVVPPAQFPLLASFAIELLYEAGIPDDVLQLLTVDAQSCRRLVVSPYVSGVVFAGPRLMAETLHRDLTADGKIMTPFIADCGGRHAVIVDSSATVDAAADSVLAAMLPCAGQMPSAPKLIFVSEPVADPFIARLADRIGELVVGDPLNPDTDIGPLIDQDTADLLDAQKMRLSRCGTARVDPDLPGTTAQGAFAAPALFEVDDAADVPDLVGPVMAVVRCAAERSAAGYAEEIAQARPRLLSAFAQNFGTIERVRRNARCGIFNVNQCGGRLIAGLAPLGSDVEAATGASLATPGWLSLFARIAVSSAQLDR